LRLQDHQLLATTKKLSKEERAQKPEEEKDRKPILKEVWDDMDELEAKRQAGTWTVEEGIRLGGYYLMVPDHVNQAVVVLRATQEREPNNFMVLGNLATAYFLQGVLDRAVSCQEEMLKVKVWPKEVPGWTADRLRWQRRVEVLYLTLLRDRANESRGDLQPRGGKPLRLDNLFPGVRFVGRDGKYAVGDIDPRMMDRLPPDAIPMVEQIILWLPEGEGLAVTWLLAELFNAHGEARAALTLIQNLRGKGIESPELSQHRRQLQEVVEALPPEKLDLEKPGDAKPNDDSSTPGLLPNWQTFGIGLGVGVIVGILLVLQLRQLFRSTRR